MSSQVSVCGVLPTPQALIPTQTPVHTVPCLWDCTCDTRHCCVSVQQLGLGHCFGSVSQDCITSYIFHSFQLTSEQFSDSVFYTSYTACIYPLFVKDTLFFWSSFGVSHLVCLIQEHLPGICAPAARSLIKVKTGSKEDTLKFSFNALECVLTIGKVEHFNSSVWLMTKQVTGTTPLPLMPIQQQIVGAETELASEFHAPCNFLCWQMGMR